MADRQYMKVIIYPLVQFVPPDKTSKESWQLEPVSFPWLMGGMVHTISVVDILSCCRAAAPNAGGHGYRFACKVCWPAKGGLRTKDLCVLWFDPRRLQWFVEVHKDHLPEGWEIKFPKLGLRPPKRSLRAATVVAIEEGPTKRVKIMPLVRFVPPDPVTRQDFRLVPEEYDWDTRAGDVHVSVEHVAGVMRASQLKHTKRGYRYSCYTRWEAEGEVFAQHNHLWFDAENLFWETDVPAGDIADGWAVDNSTDYCP